MRDLHTLPQAIVIPRLDGHGTIEYSLEFSGLPHQCGRCRSHDHQVRHCPRKEHPRKRDPKPHPIQLQTHSSSNTNEPTPSIVTPLDTKDEPNCQGQEGADQPIPTTPPAHAEPPSPVGAQQLDTVTAAEVTPNSATHEVPPNTTSQDTELRTNDINFPKLPSSNKNPAIEGEDNSTATTSPSSDTPLAHFIWRSKPPSLTQEEPEGSREAKGKAIAKASDSTPITRQGYRTGRLADDFWTTMNPPNTPQSQRKTLQVIPFFITDHNRETAEYLVDNKTSPHQPIAHVHIAELLAGIPWTEARTKQHVVNEVAQALHKVLIFTNKAPNPLQKWKQGCWFSHWEVDTEEEHICTLYVSVQVQDTKIKPRKGQNFGWRKVPTQILEMLTSHNSTRIEDSDNERSHWQQMIGTPRRSSNKPTTSTGLPQNRFSVLTEDDVLAQ